MSSGRNIKLDGATYNFIVKAYERFGYIDWCILISSFCYIPQNATLLIKLGNNEVISVVVNNLNVGKVTTGYGYIYSKVDYYSAIFDLSNEQFSKIEENGIVKIRISSRSSYKEKVWNKDKLGKYVANCRRKMIERFATTKVKSIYEDF